LASQEALARRRGQWPVLADPVVEDLGFTHANCQCATASFARRSGNALLGAAEFEVETDGAVDRSVGRSSFGMDRCEADTVAAADQLVRGRSRLMVR
jgi:hypothetical protein